jgi:hypothetical protein
MCEYAPVPKMLVHTGAEEYTPGVKAELCLMKSKNPLKSARSRLGGMPCADPAAAR